MSRICIWNKSSDEVSVWVTANTNSNGSTSWWTIPPSSWDYWSRQGSETITIYRHGYGPQAYETMVGNPGGNAIIYDLASNRLIAVQNMSGDMIHVLMGGRPNEHFVALPPSQSYRWKRDGSQTVTIYRPGHPWETKTGVPGNTLVIGSPPSSAMKNIIVKNDYADYDMWVKVSNDSNSLENSSFCLVQPGGQQSYPRSSSELVFAITTTRGQPLESLAKIDVETRLGIPGGQTVVFITPPLRQEEDTICGSST